MEWSAAAALGVIGDGSIMADSSIDGMTGAGGGAAAAATLRRFRLGVGSNLSLPLVDSGGESIGSLSNVIIIILINLEIYLKN